MEVTHIKKLIEYIMTGFVVLLMILCGIMFIYICVKWCIDRHWTAKVWILFIELIIFFLYYIGTH